MREVKMNKARLQEKLRAQSQVIQDTQCWMWTGQVSNSGHGRVTIKLSPDELNQKVSAETASYIAFVEDVPNGMFVRQTCSNRLCINPEHLCLNKF